MRATRPVDAGVHQASRSFFVREGPAKDATRQVPPDASSPRPRLLDQVRGTIRARHYSRRTEAAYTRWIVRFIRFHGTRHRTELGEVEITRFLTHLAVRDRVSASTQNQALSALIFLYREVLRRDLEWLADVVRAKRPVRLPVVLSRDEVAALMRHLKGVEWLMASLLYGAGLRLLKCCHLQVKDVDFDRGEVTLRDGKGSKDRVTLLPARVGPPLAAHLERVRRQHEEDLHRGLGSVELPAALERKYPRAPWEWGWQWVFPATRFYTDAGGVASAPDLSRCLQYALARRRRRFDRATGPEGDARDFYYRAAAVLQEIQAELSTGRRQNRGD